MAEKSNKFSVKSVNPEQSLFSDAMGISKERVKELADNSKEAFAKTIKSEMPIDKALEEITRTCKNGNELAFVVFAFSKALAKAHDAMAKARDFAK